jgi:hypothetical protein
MHCKLWISFLAVVLFVLLVQANEPPAKPVDITNNWTVDVILRSHIYLPTPRPVQDVFVVLNDTTPDLVYRIERSSAEDPFILEKEAFATTNETPHDPYKLSAHPLGPFPKGADLGFTLGQWLAANGTGTYVEENGNATLNLTFKNLVPNGTYSVWNARITMPTNFGEVLTPLGASDGSQNTFQADAEGNGAFSLKMKALSPSSSITFENYTAMYVTRTAPMPSNITWTLISVAYHSDGITHGDMPGEFGKTTHMQMVHLMYPKPAHTFQEWRNMSILAS